MMNKEMYLVEEGYPPAVWMSELDTENNAGAHLNASTFVMASGEYRKPEEMNKPQFSGQTSINWASADMKM